jgi:hypothetical protein
MDFASLAKVAVDLGVVPAIALFLVAAMQTQNRRLTTMLEKKEEAMTEILMSLVSDLTEFRRKERRSGAEL